MKYHLTATLVLAISTPGAAQIPENDDYFDLSIESLEIDVGSDERTAEGYGIAFTKEYGDRFLFLAGFKRYLFDEHDMFRMRQDLYNIGIGLQTPLTERSDVYGKLLYSGARSELETGTEYDEGVEALLGYRFSPFRHFEIDTSLRYISFEDPISFTGPELSVTGQARWYLSDLVSFGVGANYGEYETSWFGSVRVAFDLEDK